jgi:hypothetical protein
MPESDYGTGITQHYVLTLLLVVLIFGGPFGAFAVAVHIRPYHGSGMAVVAGVAIGVGSWVTAALLVVLLQIRDSLGVLASDARKDR